MKTVFNEPDANTGCYRSDKQRCRGRIIGLMLIATLFVAMSAELAAQPHQGNWIHRNASDTSFVFCLNDSGSYLAFPPSCFANRHMYGDSLYCRFDYLPLDSLVEGVDTTFLCWRRVQVGSDSTNFNFMHHHGQGGGGAMMGFDRPIWCHLAWDSSLFYHARRTWHWTGVRGWNGSAWETIANPNISDTAITFDMPTLYSAIAVVGEPTVSGVKREGNDAGGMSAEIRPNPFGDHATISFRTTRSGRATVRVFNSLGQLVATLTDASYREGLHTVAFDASALPEGIYLYKVESGGLNRTGTVVRLR